MKKDRKTAITTISNPRPCVVCGVLSITTNFDGVPSCKKHGGNYVKLCNGTISGIDGNLKLKPISKKKRDNLSLY